jgi:IS5 family transposase
MRSQKDVDARWTRKHGKSHYGYKNHVNVDRRHKLVRRYHVSDAALHDSQAVDHLLMQGNTGCKLPAGAACAGEVNRRKAWPYVMLFQFHSDRTLHGRGCRPSSALV